MEAAVAKPDSKARAGTFADLRAILSDKVRVPPTNEELRQWIDEARSRTFDSNLMRRLGRGTQSIDDDENTR
jgi:hypothetical protein